MFTEAQNFAIVQTELDTVFFQTFQYDSSTPGIATASTATIFKPVSTTHAAYFEEYVQIKLLLIDLEPLWGNRAEASTLKNFLWV